MKKAIARAFQSAAVGHLEEKLVLGLELCKQKGVFVQDVVVSGGVASNQYLRERCVASHLCLGGFADFYVPSAYVNVCWTLTLEHHTP